MLYEKVQSAVKVIRECISLQPEVAIILGSGLGSVAEKLEQKEIIAYKDIPGFPPSSVAGHAAQLVFGLIGEKKVVAMQGRFHFYEGLSMKEITFPIYVLKELGVKNIIITNACGGINTDFAPGDLMLISDHINMFGNNPLIGPNDERFGPRFPDMTTVYDPKLRQFAKDTAAALSIPIKEGVYAFFTGPCFETAAEIRAFKTLGADAIGMSTIPEAIVARYLGMHTLGISCITNMATGIAKTEHSHEAVLATAERSSKLFCLLIEKLLADFPEM